MNERLHRRAFLHRAAALGGAALLPGSILRGQEEKPKLISRQKDPVNMESPFTALSSFITPNDLFYIRNHYTQPKVERKGYTLKVEGAVKRPLELTAEELRKLGEKTLPLTLECAGNGRSFIVPKAKGVQWGLGAVSTAEWTGVPLAAVLDRAGVEPGAVDVVLEGADSGDPKKEGQPPVPVTFARGLPLAKAQKPEVLLAWAMNGTDLPAAHGAPLRAVVGGWYGMASVKWLKRIIVTKLPFLGFDQTFDYAVWSTEHGLPTLVPLGGVTVKSSIARPAEGEEVPAGKPYRVHGAAWAGEEQVRKVDVSSDGGKTWSEARLLGKPVPFCWRLWEWTWTPGKAGKTTLMVRATDSAGRTQPMSHDPMRRNYMISFVRPTAVVVKG